MSVMYFSFNREFTASKPIAAILKLVELCLLRHYKLISHWTLHSGVVFMSYDGHISKPGITELKVGSSENWYSRVR